MTQHTQGPWSVNTLTPWQTEVFAGSHLICEAVGGQAHLGQPRDFAVDEANARLIAAAPEMLDALKFVFDHIADPERGPRDLYPAFGLHSSTAVAMVRDAIAKAEGRRVVLTQPREDIA